MQLEEKWKKLKCWLGQHELADQDMKEKGKEKCFGKTNKQRSIGMNIAKHGV